MQMRQFKCMLGTESALVQMVGYIRNVPNQMYHIL